MSTDLKEAAGIISFILLMPVGFISAEFTIKGVVGPCIGVPILGVTVFVMYRLVKYVNSL